MGLIFRTDWVDVPHTDSDAKPVLFEVITRPRVIVVQKGSYRHAKFENVCFEIAPQQGNIDTYNPAAEPAEMKVKVLCLWYGHFPPTQRFITITVNGPYVVREANADDVVRDIAYRAPEQNIKVDPDD